MKIGISMLDIKNIKNSPKFKKYACLSVIALCLVGYIGYNFFKTEPVSYMSVNAQKEISVKRFLQQVLLQDKLRLMSVLRFQVRS